MSLHDSRILAALVRAKARIERGNVGTQRGGCSCVCTRCGMEHRSNASLVGGRHGDGRPGCDGPVEGDSREGRIERFNPNHDPKSGEFASGSGLARQKELARFKRKRGLKQRS